MEYMRMGTMWSYLDFTGEDDLAYVRTGRPNAFTMEES